MFKHDIIEAAAMRDYAIYVRFADGTDGTIKLDRLVKMPGVFKPLADLDQFNQVRVDPRFHCVEWPNGADLAPEVLYEKVKNAKPGEPVEY